MTDLPKYDDYAVSSATMYGQLDTVEPRVVVVEMLFVYWNPGGMSLNERAHIPLAGVFPYRIGILSNNGLKVVW